MLHHSAAALLPNRADRAFPLMKSGRGDCSTYNLFKKWELKRTIIAFPLLRPAGTGGRASAVRACDPFFVVTFERRFPSASRQQPARLSLN